MVCPESYPNRTLYQSLQWETLQMPWVWGKPLVHAHIWSSTRGFLQVGTLQMQWVWESFLAVLTPPHPKRIHTRGLFKCPQCQQSFRQYARHIGRQKAHNGEKPQQVCKKLLTELWLSYSSEKPYWWKYVYLSWMWQKHELEEPSWVCTKETQSEERPY